MQTVSTEFDTIAAISTPPGEGGISIIRISGVDALKTASQIYRGKDLNKVNSHTINYGHIIDPENGNEVDEVMVSVMRAPHTYTKEDIVEINCHGGIVATNRILQIILGLDARLAKPGEFTERAFLNGRIDLSQAEAVMDLIRAKTDQSMKVALDQLDGNLSHLITNLRQNILDVLAQVEVNIDYPEYDDVETMTARLLKEKAIEVKAKIQQLLSTAKQGKVLRDGLATAIIGHPNVGKSSILNHLLHEDKAIVTDVAGTTRDVIEEYVNVQGVPLKLVDTAGIHETEDKVEKIGVDRSRKALSKADLVILVLDSSVPLRDEDRELLRETNHMQRIVVLNKSDLEVKINLNELQEYVDDKEIIKSSAVSPLGTKDLEDRIAAMFFAGSIENTSNNIMVTNARHIGLLKQAETALDAVLEGIETGMPVDLVQIDMTRAWDLLGEITGDSYQDELLDQLFSQFCLGK
ncbi:MAG: tRNA uridine-5-carboxymethylaminomethyl(34) synthesis GTPase MnmE [Pediococcus pentosaceus]|jgi:tRNA modification GTPase|uniref:tRNA uridine-5-carboxymethylaminomethyl(34) synthesis GTPase MnmE n=1 Tax=Pediococcus pentosaceus TaxID=1255 RepID=UPI0003C338C9|nr:tRNA uridine-5-carboxymethylaminomethyl(34) synthesis GTPase MnmE [Pediococcus pentosaceus]AHA05868.1 tRNA modification GTPase [Pediococcus pentosaceus SL4]KAF0523720.1 tRNA uridine-5-carboxymethylaminomethyl(34) synthesis GTPase MnmE [Pediococcus pentosaceus]MCH4015996.1 tRNA uridine-5-carboxymethylaminomethyl(34) synthesis GTPase MnmE [Pediococcus pentosaceus]MCH4058385.1 tRNA uridine-5-carboxymethylaminomethyl(34) synthesis GTPase MnmE [Pediococcus pentosaceus]MCH4098246.1 tRNA uridine-5